MFETQGHSTSLIEIRSFLEAERVAPPPWATPQTNIEVLYALLKGKRDDDLFWARLRSLVERIEDARVDMVRLGFCEALGYASVEKMLADLRADLRTNNEASPKPWKQAIASSLRATALAAFLVLGVTITACEEPDDDDIGGTDADSDSDSDSDSDTDTETEELCDEAKFNGIWNEEGEVFCDLVDIINSSDLTNSQKADLLYCLPELDASYREELLDAFQNMDEEEIAENLQQMLSYNGVCYEDDDDGGH